MLIQYDHQIGHRFVPNMKARIPNENGGYFVNTNSLGFRSDVPFCKEKTNGPRILFFGDSYTAGDNCENAERFSDKVGQMLNAEVFNYGLSGSGTDQHLLIYERFARDIEADLIVLCVQVDSMKRIQVSHRESIDRITGERVLVPKPYFQLEGEELVLKNVPVPRERPELAMYDNQNGKFQGQKNWKDLIIDRYRTDPHLKWVREAGRSRMERFKSELYRLSRSQPYKDYCSENSPGWRLMEAILRQFIDKVAPLPVLIVPVPSYVFSLHRVSPIYQRLFERLEDPGRGVSVLDITSPLSQLPWKSRQKLAFQHDTHFSSFGHDKVAELISEEITRKKLLPEQKTMREIRKSESSSPLAISRPSREKSITILGLSCFYHNSAACLIKDGQIVSAADEERFSRVKNDRRFPHQAVNYCLEEGGLNQEDLTAVVYYDNPYLTFERLLHTQLAVAEEGEENWLRFLPSWVRYKLHLPQLIRSNLSYSGNVLFESHHRSHSAAAFYPSPFERAAIMTLDGVGEWATASIGLGKGSQIELLQEMRFPHSLGMLYSAMTQFTGFKVNSGEYKMMGLAPYGEPKYVNLILEHLVDIKEDGSLELNLEYFDFLSKPSMTNERLAELFKGAARSQEGRITRREMDIAASIQVVTEMIMLRMAQYAHKVTGEKNLCLAGGVALNCVANGRLLREGPFSDIWIQPAAGDSGNAIGAALDAYHSYYDQPRNLQADGCSIQGGSFLGPEFSDDEVRAFLDTHGYPYQMLTSEERGESLAQFLGDGKVVGHFSGRMEFGPRSLGARSILGDARNEEMQVNLNVKIKYRESFRPFAPSVLAEKVNEYFELDRPSPYMLVVAPVKKERQIPFEVAKGEDLLEKVRQVRSDIPAVTHVDFSARIQTVHRSFHPMFYDLIQQFEKLTGYGVVVNTSFNVRGEPIICTPYDAYRCFMRTEMDVLALGNFLLLKEKQPSWPESKGHLEKPDDVETVNDSSPLIPKLRHMYSSDFIPTMRQYKEKSFLGIHTLYRERSSTWEQCASSSGPFLVPPELDSLTPEPESMANTMVQYWAGSRETTEALLPFVIRLLRLGLRYPAKEELEEEVSDSVYVVF